MQGLRIAAIRGAQPAAVHATDHAPRSSVGSGGVDVLYLPVGQDDL